MTRCNINLNGFSGPGPGRWWVTHRPGQYSGTGERRGGVVLCLRRQYVAAGPYPQESQPRRAYRALLADDTWTLLFNHQGGFGNLGPKRKASSTLPAYTGPIEGMLFVLPKQDLKKLQAAETGYRIGKVKVRVPCPGPECTGYMDELQQEFTVDALSFLSNWDIQLPTSLPPTASYRDKLRDGALHYNLSREYVAWLDGLPVLTESAASGSRALPDEYYQTPANRLAAPVLLAVLLVLYRLCSSLGKQ